MKERKPHLTKGCFFTGHRPDKLGGWDEKNETATAVKTWLWKAIKRAIKGGHHTFISGAALGVDTWAAEAVHELKQQYPNIRLVLAIPFSNQAEVWRQEAKTRWQRLVDIADEVIIVSPNPPDGAPRWQYAQALHKRNQYMVDHGHSGIAVWNGDEKGGTSDCLGRAKKKKRPVLRLNPTTMEEELLQ